MTSFVFFPAPAPLVVSRDLKCSERCSAEEIRELNVGGAMALLSCLRLSRLPPSPLFPAPVRAGYNWNLTRVF